MNTKNKIRIFGVLLLLFGVTGLLNMVLDIKKAKDSDTLHISNTNYKDYFDLFDTSIQKKLNLVSSYSSKNRNPIVIYTYKDDKIIVYKISTIFNDKLYNVNIYSSDEEHSSGPVYGFVQDKQIEFMYKTGEMDKVKNIYIGYSGDNLEYKVKNDSTLSFSFIMKDFFIKYGKNDNIDLFIRFHKSYNQKKNPVNVQLVKRHNELYLIVLYDNFYKILDEDIEVK